MNLLKQRLTATDEKLKELKAARREADKARRTAYKLSRADRARKAQLVGEAVLHRLHRGEWDEEAFRQMMDEYVSRPADWVLFELD